MKEQSNPDASVSEQEFRALQTVIEALRDLDPEARHRILESCATFLGITLRGLEER